MTAPALRVAAVILAAGEAKRFGGQKLLALLGGKPLLQHALDAANASSLAPLALVVGADADAVLAGVALGRARPVHNPAFATGQSSSVQAGLRAVEEADAAVVLLGDQPRVTAALLEALVGRQRECGAAAVVSRWGGKRMPPTLLHRDLWPAVHALSGDVGAREVLTARDDVAVLDVPAALGALDDVDTREDYARLTSRA